MPYYIELNGAELPGELQEADYKMCGAFTLTDGPYCCAMQSTVRVRYCGADVYIYQFKPKELPGKAALCVTSESSSQASFSQQIHGQNMREMCLGTWTPIECFVLHRTWRADS